MHNLEQLVLQMLHELKIDVFDENFLETPRRVAAMLLEFHQPFDPQTLLRDGFSLANYSGMVTQKNIPFVGMCAHHLLPMYGRAAIGYVPHKRVLGLSKLTRLVRAIGHETPSLQETLTDRIADILWQHLEPKGVIVVIDAEHSCMSARGVKALGVITVTSSLRGIYRDVPQAREEFFNLIKYR